MLKRWIAFSLCTVLASVANADKTDKGQSARETEAAKVKGEPKKGNDLSARLDALEKQVRELTAMIKQQGAKPGGKEAADIGGLKKAEVPFAKSVAVQKPAPSPEAHAKAVAAKLEAVKKQEHGKVQKPQAKAAPEKLPPGKKPEAKPVAGKGDTGKSGEPLVIKGKDGQLYVRVSALPPGFQQKFSGQEGHGKSAPKGKDDDDDDDDDKKPGKKNEKDDD